MFERKLSVLIVDDELIIRKGIRKLFNWEEHGFTVIGEAINGFDALEFLGENRTDVVVTDIKMPLMDGITLSNEISKRFPATEIIIITGYDEFSYAKAAVRAGVSDFLLKPVDPEELTESMLRIKKKILNRSINYPFSEEADIKKAILNQDNDAALKALNSVFADFMQNQVPVTAVKNIALKLVSEINTTYKMYISVEPAVPPPILANVTTVAEIKKELEDYLNRFFRKSTSGSTDTLVKNIVSYLEENYRQNISLTMLENEFHFNASYISRIFKNKVGKNYNEYLLNIRINHAKNLLKNSKLSITEISDAVGFGNSKYFSRVFKNLTGLQPIAYRTKYRHENEQEI